MYVKVAVPLNLDQLYTYRALDFKPQIGDCIRVNFAGRISVAFVFDLLEDASNCNYKIKDVISVVERECIDYLHVQFLKWVASYYMASIGTVLKSAILEPIEVAEHFTFNSESKVKETTTYKKIKSIFKEVISISSVDLRFCGVRKSTVQKMVEQNVLVKLFKPKSKDSLRNKQNIDQISLSKNQQNVANKIDIKSFKAYLLDGVTGSGKTAVYTNKIIEAINQNQHAQCLLMLPEISLTVYILDKIKNYLKHSVEIAEWHSGLSKSKKSLNWHKIKNGQAKLIIGARSAILLPIPNLKLIVIDEEHDSSYKQEQGQFTYNARDAAIKRAKTLNIPIILSSATPALECFYNASFKNFCHIKLQSRFGSAKMPDVFAIDMRLEKKVTKYISKTLYEELKKNLEDKMQSLIFINKRGYARFILCQSCGCRIKCPNCSTWLAEHKKKAVLLCHLCCFSMLKPKTCADCQSEELISFGPGIEQIEEELLSLFKNANIASVSSDVKAIEVFKLVEDKKVDIIVGTQIASKGYDFANLTLLGVIDADSGVHSGDLRNNEKKFQILQQVIGRVGRRKSASGKVFLQSYKPETQLIDALVKDKKDMFYAQEMQSRKLEFMPPFSRLASIIISAFDKEEVEFYCRKLASKIVHQDDLQIFGPAPAPIECVSNRHRYRFLLVASKGCKIQKYIKFWTSSCLIPPKIKLQIDIDPLNFF